MSNKYFKKVVGCISIASYEALVTESHFRGETTGVGKEFFIMKFWFFRHFLRDYFFRILYYYNLVDLKLYKRANFMYFYNARYIFSSFRKSFLFWCSNR